MNIKLGSALETLVGCLRSLQPWRSCVVDKPRLAADPPRPQPSWSAFTEHALCMNFCTNLLCSAFVCRDEHTAPPFPCIPVYSAWLLFPASSPWEQTPALSWNPNPMGLPLSQSIAVYPVRNISLSPTRKPP